MADFPDIGASDYSFTLAYNTHSFQSPLTRSTQTASLPGAQWQCVSTYSNKTGADARTLKSFVLGLGGQVGRFNFTPPDLDQQGTLLGTPVIDGAGQTGSTINIRGWDSPQANPLSAGDYLSFNGELKTVTGAITTQNAVSYQGITNSINNPYDPTQWILSAAEGDITRLDITNPSGQSFVGRAVFDNPDAFVVIQGPQAVFNVTAGDRIFISLVVKNINEDSAIRFRFADDTAFIVDKGVNTASGLEVYGGNGAVTTLDSTDLGDGYYLMQVSCIAPRTTTAFDCRILLTALSNSSTSVVANTELHLQSLFTGVSANPPGLVTINTTIPIAPPLRRSPPDSAIVEVEKPFMTAKLEDDAQTSFQVSTPIIYNASFSIVEVF